MRFINPTLLGFFKKELIQVFRDKRMRMMLIMPPLIQMTIFGLAISTQTRNIRLAAVYAPQDSASRRVAERCFASGWFVPARVTGNDPFEWVRSGKADAVMLAPPRGLTRALGRGDTADHSPVQLLVNASNIVKAQNIESYFQNILNREAGEEVFGKAPSPPLSFTFRFLYNPEMETSWFMVPGVLCMILLVIALILTSTSIAREKEMGTFETLLASPAATWEILLGKALSYVFLGMLNLPFVLGIAVFGFHVPMRGNFFVLLLGTFAFVCTIVALGILLSTFTRTMAQVSMASFFFIFPAIQLSGIMYPVENMPALLKITAYLNPLMYYTTLLRNIMLKGGEPSVVIFNTGMLFLLGVVAVYLGFKRFHETLD
jgi:ABC-2 type transport system permease protein